MVVKGVGCDLFVASGRPLRGECRPRGVYRGLRSPAALASPVLSVDPAVFTTNTAERYDPDLDSWTPIASMGTAREYLGLTAL